MTWRVLPKVLLATALAGVGGGCSSGDAVSNDGAGGRAWGGTAANGGQSGGAIGGEGTAGQTTSASAGIGGIPEQAGGHAGSGGGATAGVPSSSIGGAGSAGSGSDSGGASAYAPCPTDGSPCKILPLGDSITRGAKSSDDAGYRSQLFKLVVAANQNLTFTGSLINGPTQVSGQPFPRMHEGHSGWTISQVASLIPTPALDDKPNIILLHIGTNDIGSRNPTAMAMRLEALVDQIAENAPDALIVVAQITTARTDNDIRDAYNANIPAIVQSHAAKGQHVIGVDANKVPTAGLSSDGVHPNDQGYEYMAGVWYAAIKDLLPAMGGQTQ